MPFAVARLVSCDLCRTNTSEALLFEIRLDLLTSWAGCVDCRRRQIFLFEKESAAKNDGSSDFVAGAIVEKAILA